MTDPYEAWFYVEQPKKLRTLCFTRGRDKINRFMVDSGDVEQSRRAVEKATEDRPVLAVIKGGA